MLDMGSARIPDCLQLLRGKFLGTSIQYVVRKNHFKGCFMGLWLHIQNEHAFLLAIFLFNFCETTSPSLLVLHAEKMYHAFSLLSYLSHLFIHDPICQVESSNSMSESGNHNECFT